MKTELYTNCSLVRVPIKAGVDEYYLPQNVDWANRKIDRMIICAPQTACTDPIDGVTPVLGATDIQDLYISLYDVNNHEIMHDVAWEQISHRNNNTLRVDAQLNLSQCRLYFTTAPAADATLLIYVYYGTRTEDYYDLPKKSVTARFDLDADQEMTFQEVINTYVHALPATLKGIICWDAYNTPLFITLRDYTYTYQMANVCSELMRPDLNAGATGSQAALFFLNDLDIDFDYSHVRNAQNQAVSVMITFLYD
jgi:hypothetical protein